MPDTDLPDAPWATPAVAAPPPANAPDTSSLPDAPWLQQAAKPKFGWQDTWPVQAAKSIYNAVTLPGDVAAGKVDPESDEAIGRSFDLAGIASPASIASKGVPVTADVAKAGRDAALGSAGNIGVDLPLAIATDSPTAKLVGQAVTKAPGGGPLTDAIKSSVGQLEDATGRAADMAGGNSSPATAGASFRNSVENHFKPKVKQELQDSYNKVGELIDPEATAPLPATMDALNNIISRREASGEPSVGKAAMTALEGATRPEGMTYNGIKDLRSRVGEMLDTGIFPEGMSQAELRQLYGSLSGDLKGAVQQLGGDKASTLFARANDKAKDSALWKDKLSKVIGPDSRSDEGIAASLVRLAGKGPTADIETLGRARGAVTPEAWSDISSSAITRLGRDKAGEFSPGRFFSDYGNLSPAGKTLLFGSVGKGELMPFLNDIAAVSKKFVEAGKLANTSGTAGHNAALVGLGAVGAGLVHGSLMEPTIALGALIGNNLVARALATRQTAASMARWSKVYASVAHAPNEAATRVRIPAMLAATKDLSRSLRSQFGVRVPALEQVGPQNQTASNREKP